MLVREWMTSEVITASADSSILKVSKQMKEFKIKRVPIVDGNHNVVGIVSDGDIHAASPSKATSLDMHELYYLLSEIKVKDIMTSKPVLVNQMESVEQVALTMQEKGLSCLPVVDDAKTLVGIISEHDIFRVLVEITGVRQGGLQIALSVDDIPGTLQPIMDDIRAYKGSIISILSGNLVPLGKRHLYIRIRAMDEDTEKQLIESLKVKYNLLYFVREKAYEL